MPNLVVLGVHTLGTPALEGGQQADIGLRLLSLVPGFLDPAGKDFPVTLEFLPELRVLGQIVDLVGIIGEVVEFLGLFLVTEEGERFGKTVPEYRDAVEQIELIDYKVRIITRGDGTRAVTRVMIESRDAEGNNWATVGVSTNIIEASYNALRDSITYKLFKSGVRSQHA